jgi:hypothetical protein
LAFISLFLRAVRALCLRAVRAAFRGAAFLPAEVARAGGRVCAVRR